METLDPLRPALELVASCLAPSAILVAVGLLAAGLQMKYTALVGDLRAIAEECRGGDGAPDDTRAAACREQARSLLGRTWLVRCALVWLYAAVLLALLASVAIGASAALPGAGWMRPALLLTLFGGSLLAVVVGIGYALAEARHCFDLVAAEIRDLGDSGVIAPKEAAAPKEEPGDAAVRT